MSRIWDALRRAERQRSRADTLNLASDVGSGPPAAPARDASDRRRGQRREYRVSLLVYGSGDDREPFHEQTDTIDAHENGCGLILEKPVARDQRLCLINPRNQADQECRVVYVGKPALGKSRVGVAFMTPAPHFWRSA